MGPGCRFSGSTIIKRTSATIMLGLLLAGSQTVFASGGGIVTDDPESLNGAAREDTYSPYAQRNFPDRPLYETWAVGNLDLSELKKDEMLKGEYAREALRLLGYTPAGLVVGGAVAAGQEMQQKIVLQDMNLEIEVQDSQTQKVLAAMVDKIDPGKKANASESWSKEHTVMDYWANRFHCRLENSQKPENEWQDCEKALP